MLEIFYKKLQLTRKIAHLYIVFDNNIYIYKGNTYFIYLWVNYYSESKGIWYTASI